MRDEFLPAIEALQRDLADLDRKVAETKNTINRLCELAGREPMYADVGAASQPTLTAIRADTFYGKPIITGAREYLEMRRTAGLGPATPREIYEALKKGGLVFDTKIESNAITGIRNALRKSSAIFHRLPNGEYGLLKWYPRAKAPKDNSSEGEDNTSERAAEPRARKKPRAKRPRKARAAADKQPTAASGLGETPSSAEPGEPPRTSDFGGRNGMAA